MRWPSTIAASLLATATASCAFLLDFDGLQAGAEATGGGGGSLAIDQAPTELAKAVCAAYERCMGPIVDVMFAGEDCAKVTADTISEGIFLGLKPSLDAGRVVYHADLAPQCIADFAELECGKVLDWPQSCYAALEGTVGLNGDCERSPDCVPGYFCNLAGGCPGKCIARLGELESCGSDSDCAAGLRCEDIGDGGGRKCQMPSALGQPCKGNAHPDCALGLMCLGIWDVTAQAGTCVDAVSQFTATESGACSLKTGPLCAEGLSCAVDTMQGSGTCQQKVGAGQPCKVALPDICPVGQFCNLITKQCEALPADGEACQKVGLKQPCVPYARCGPDGLCHDLKHLNDPCLSSAQCYSGHCHETDAVCVPLDGCP